MKYLRAPSAILFAFVIVPVGIRAQADSPRIVNIALNRSMQAPLPAPFEVQRIAASDRAIWFQGLDHSTHIPKLAVYHWSAAGVRQAVMPESSDGEPIVIRDLFSDATGRTYLLTNQGLYEADGNTFRYRSDFAGLSIKAIAGDSEFWLISQENEVYQLSVLNGSARRKKVDNLGVIEQWTTGASGDLWIAARGAKGTRLHRLDRSGSGSTEIDLGKSDLAQATALYADANDSLWISFSDGQLARYSAGAIDWFGSDHGLNGPGITRIIEDRLGNYYLLQPLADSQDSSILAIPRSERSSVHINFLRARLPQWKGAVRTAAIDHLGGVWLSIGRHGAFRLQGLRELNWPRGTAIEDLKPVASPEVLKHAAVETGRSAEASTGITALPGTRFTILNASRGMVNDFVSCIVSDTSGNIYFTTGFENQGDDPAVAGGGIARWDHRQVISYTTAHGLAANTVQACAFDAARNMLWFGTSSGVSRFNPATSTFTTFLPGQKVQDIAVSGSNIWVGTFANGVYQLDAASGSQLNQYSVGNNRVISLVLDNNGTVWAGTSGSGLYSLGTSFTAVTTPAGGTALIQDLEVDASNNLWISVWNQGVYRRTPAGAYTQFTSANGLGGVFAGLYRTYRIERDASQNLWFSHGNFGPAGTPNTAVTFLASAQVNGANPAFERYSTANGFPVNVVLALYSENASTMWFGSQGGGAWRLGGPSYAPGWPKPVSSVFFPSPLLVDLDGNRTLEIVVGDNSGLIHAFKPNGETLWTYDTRNAFPGQNTGQMSIQSSVAAGDVDGDGETELVVGLGGQMINGTWGQGGVLILSRSGAFERVLYTLDVFGGTRTGLEDGFREGVFATPVLANVDSDPELEIMVGAFDNHFYSWNGDGTPIFSKDDDGDGRWDEDGFGDTTPNTPFNLGDDFPGIRFVDDDKDGQTDEGHPSDDDEDGRIDEDYPEWPINVRDTTVASAAVFDLYSNGQKAIIFGHDYSGDNVYNRGGMLRAHDARGESLPGFPKANLEQVIWSSPVIVDLDNDGAYEIVHGSGLDLSTVGNSPADALIGQLVYAWRRDGASFKPGANGRLATTEGRSWGSFAVGDLDNDGSPELVIATTSLRNKQDQIINQSGAVVDRMSALGQKVYAFRADGAIVPGFPVRPYPISPDTNLIGSPVLADIDGDGFLDIVIGVGPGLVALDRNGRTLSGLGVFENLQEMSHAGEVNTTPAIGDIDLDGALELVWIQGTGNGSTGLLHVMKLGPVNATFPRSWPMWRRGANRNGVFAPLIGLAQVYETSNMAQFNVQGFAGRSPISSVRVNLSSLGGSSSFALADNGSGGDPVGNDGWFTGSFNVAGLAAGRYVLEVTLTDIAGRTDTQSLVYVRRASTAQLQIAPPALNFGTVAQGDASQLQMNAVNIGNAPVTVSSITTSNAEFTIGSPATFPQVISPGGILMATVRFRPGAAGGARNATLTVQSNDPTGNSKTLALSGSAPGGTGGCTFTLTPGSSVVMYTGTKATFTLNAGAPSCAWSASSNRSWAQVFPLSGTGSRVIDYTIFPNFSTLTRSATITVSGATFSITQHPATGTPNQRFVSQIYFNILGRLASASEIALQANALASGMSRADLVWNFFNSAEFNLGGRFVAGLYVGLLNRNAEYGGWLFQRNALSTGVVNPNQLVNNFISSVEYGLKFGNPSNDEFVRLLYRYILLREASPSEVQFQAGALASGLTRMQLAANFLNSPEFRNATGSRLTAFLLYALLLQRDPSDPERAQREAQIAGGADIKALIAELLNTSEFGQLLQ